MQVCKKGNMKAALLLLLYIGCFFSSFTTACAEVPAIWLKQDPVSYKLDGSAYSRLTLMEGNKPIKNGTPIDAAVCKYVTRKGETKTILLEAEKNTDNIVYEIASPTSATCNAMVSLNYNGSNYIAQSVFPLYGSSWKTDIAGVAANFKRSGAVEQLNNNRYAQSGQKLDFLYNTPADGVEIDKITAYLYGIESGGSIKAVDNRFSYTVANKDLLTVSVWEKPLEVLLVVESHGAKDAYYSSLAYSVYQARHGYLNISHGIWLMLLIAAISFVIIKIYQRGSARDAYK